MKIAISAETTIDLPKDLLEQFDIHTVPFSVVLGEDAYLDGSIEPEKLFAYTDKTGELPRTAAVNEYQYEEHFKKLLESYDAVVHFSLSSHISAAYSNAVKLERKYENVYVVDTLSLSTGIALQAIYARKLANAGKTPREIVDAIEKRVPYDQTSFSLESVNYLYKGGRCSKLAMLGANLLKLKPEILMLEGSMAPGNKYRGPMKKVVLEYVDNILSKYNNIDPEEVFITYSTAPDEVVEAVKERLQKAGFKNIHPTRAGATISCHCGPHCLGILYMNDGPHPID